LIESTLRRLAADDEDDPEFTPLEEQAIVSVLLDVPDYALRIHGLLHPDLFQTPPARFVVNELVGFIKAHGVVPTRPMLTQIVRKLVTNANPNWHDIDRLVTTPAHPRDVPAVEARLHEWANYRQLHKVYEPVVYEQFRKGNVQAVIDVLEDYRALNRPAHQSLIDVYRHPELAFPDLDTQHLALALPRLMELLNDGGPGRGEVLIYLGRTGVGKSILMANDAVASARAGQKTMVISLENSVEHTWQKFGAILTGIPLKQLAAERARVEKAFLREVGGYQDGNLFANRWPAKSCSAADVLEAIRERARDGWIADVVVIDYLELMVPAGEYDRNQPEYLRQQIIADDLKKLAGDANALVITATQANREGARRGAKLEMTMLGGSYGKAQPVDYVVAIDQEADEKMADPPRQWVSVLKNRNGPDGEAIGCVATYDNQRVTQADRYIQKITGGYQPHSQRSGRAQTADGAAAPPVGDGPGESEDEE
jgi:replicative DNA helicase